MSKKVSSFSKVELLDLLNQSESFADFIRKIGYAHSSGSYKSVKKFLDLNGIDYSHLVNKRWSSSKKENDEVFVENSSYDRKGIKRRLINEQLIPYYCSICNNKGEWNGIQLSLQLDHINGINNDNRLSNLRFLCPNCHSQTDTYAGKNNAFNLED